MLKRQFVKIFKDELLNQIEDFDVIPTLTYHNIILLNSYSDKVYERIKKDKRIHIKDIGRIFFHFKLYEDYYYYDVFDVFEVNVHVPFKLDVIYTFTININWWEC